MYDTTLVLLIEGNPPTRICLGYKKTGFGQGKYTGFGGKLETGENPREAAVRELAEEAGLGLASSQLETIAVLRFRFPHRPEWSQQVHVFIARQWPGAPAESVEMRPDWFWVDAIPYAQMWDDARIWLPLILAGQRFQADFTFQADNATVEQVRFLPF